MTQMNLYLPFNGLYCAVRACRPRKSSTLDTVPDERLHPKIWEAFCMAVASPGNLASQVCGQAQTWLMHCMQIKCLQLQNQG